MHDIITSAEDLTECYNSVLRQLIEQHASLMSRIFPIKDKVPWYSEDIAEAKQERRKCERRWWRTSPTIYRDTFKTAPASQYHH